MKETGGLRRMEERGPAWAVLGLSALTALLSFLPVMLANGGLILLRGDFLTQQIPFLVESRRMVLSGAPFWSWNTFLGANFLGSYSFYTIGSPFFWPLLFLPERALTAGVTVLFLIKHVVAAAGGYWYLGRYVKNRWYAVAGGLLYAFSSFTVDSSYYYHFLDVIALAPFLFGALDRVLDRRPYAMPALALMSFLLAMTNYYFFIAISVFFLIYLWFKRLEPETAPSWGFLLRVTLLYGGGALLASFLLVPSALTLLETSKATESFSGITRYLALLPQIPMLIKGLILPHEGIAQSGVYFQFSEFCSNTAFLPLTGAVLAFTGACAAPREWDSRLLKFLVVLTLVPLGNGLFSLFSNLSYTRWWFLLALMLVLETVRCIERLNGEETERAWARLRAAARFLTKAALWATLPFLLLRALFAYPLREALPASWAQAFAAVRLNAPFTGTDGKFLALLLFLIAVNFLPLLACVHRDLLRRAGRFSVIAAAVCAVSYAAYLSVGEGLVGGRGHIPLGQLAENVAPRADDVVKQGTDYAFRTDSDSRLDNLAMILNRPGARTFHSFKSRATSAFGRRVGYDIASPPLTLRYFDTPAMYALLGVKEVLAESWTPGEGYTPIGSEGSRELYTTDDYVPIGYAVEYYTVDDSPDPGAASTDRTQNNAAIERMVKACVVDSQTAEKLEGIAQPCPEERLAMPWREAAAENRANACSGFTADSSGFSAVWSGERSCLLFFSVPHDAGWSATVDGEKTEILTLNYGLMGIVVPSGEAVEVRFRFTPPGLTAGWILSAAAAAGLLTAGGLWLIGRGKRRMGPRSSSPDRTRCEARLATQTERRCSFFCSGQTATLKHAGELPPSEKGRGGTGFVRFDRSGLPRGLSHPPRGMEDLQRRTERLPQEGKGYDLRFR